LHLLLSPAVDGLRSLTKLPSKLLLLLLAVSSLALNTSLTLDTSLILLATTISIFVNAS
jgi:hypothetical protein